jgi:hypothetical protein
VRVEREIDEGKRERDGERRTGLSTESAHIQAPCFGYKGRRSRVRERDKNEEESVEVHE